MVAMTTIVLIIVLRPLSQVETMDSCTVSGGLMPRFLQKLEGIESSEMGLALVDEVNRRVIGNSRSKSLLFIHCIWCLLY